MGFSRTNEMSEVRFRYGPQNMKKSEYLLRSFINAAGVFVYVALIAWLGFNSKTIFGEAPSFIAPLFMLLLFVVSACITGLLVLGKPILMYLNNQRREAIVLFSVTLSWLVLFLAIIATALALR